MCGWKYNQFNCSSVRCLNCSGHIHGSSRMAHTCIIETLITTKWNQDQTDCFFDKIKSNPNCQFYYVSISKVSNILYICDTISNELCLFLHKLIKYTSANVVFYLLESLTFFRATPFRMANMRSLLRSAAGGADLGGDTLRSWICPRCSEANTSSIVPVVQQNSEDEEERNSKDSSPVDPLKQ